MEQVKHIDLGEICASISVGASAKIEAIIEQNSAGTVVNRMTVSDLVGEDIINMWEPGKIVMIIAGTGTGKSYFICNSVFKHFKAKGKKILYLVSRLRLKEQFERYMCGEADITFMTYQAIEAIQSAPQRNLEKWDIIVCDECHYFVSDSGFNNQTDISFDWVMEQQNAIRIFLTATGDGIDRYLNEQKIAFDKIALPLSSRQIKSLNFFHSESQMEMLAEQVVSSGGKGIFFLSSLETVYNLSQKFKKNSLFICSEHNKKFAKYMDVQAVSKIIEAEHFDCSLLFSTTVIDVGITLRDRALTTMVVDMPDPKSIIQCVGRKRFIDDADYVDLYVHSYTNNQIGGKLTDLKKKVDNVRCLNNEGALAYNAANNRGNDDSGLVFDKAVTVDGKIYFEKAVNTIKHAYIMQMIEIYKQILQNDNGYIGYVAELLGIEEYSILEAEQKKHALSYNLERFVGKPMLTSEDKEPFIQEMGIGRKKGKDISRSYSVLAAWLESNNLPYRLAKYRTSRTSGKMKQYFTAWEVLKLSKS